MKTKNIPAEKRKLKCQEKVLQNFSELTGDEIQLLLEATQNLKVETD